MATRVLPAAYVAAVALVALSRALTGEPTVTSLALSPDRLAAGKVWLMASSAFVINGPVLPQIAGLAATTVVFRRELGARAFAVVAPLAHVGCTLLAYGMLQVVTGDADGPGHPGLDYGISAVWLGMLGALTAANLPGVHEHARPSVAIVSISAAAGLVAITLFPPLAATEHGFSFTLGVLAGGRVVRARAAIARRRGARPAARSGASTASGRAASA